jgi:hypothetical protein
MGCIILSARNARDGIPIRHIRQWPKSIWGPWKELGNPCQGEKAQTTFDSQSTYVLPIPNKLGCFFFMADRWRPQNAIDGRYVWLPIEFEDNRPILRWRDEWDLSFFDSKP